MADNETKATAETEAAAEPKETKKAKPAAKASGSIADIMETIKAMTVVELAELVKTLEDEFGISAAVPMAAAAPAGAAAGGAAADAEEQTEFSVILTNFGENKINVIKAVRELTSLGLKESKDLVEGAPKPVKEGIGKEDAEAAKKKLEEAGATAEVK